MNRMVPQRIHNARIDIPMESERYNYYIVEFGIRSNDERILEIA
jgi:hypothetical protein